jgi:D-alanyl-D-alanine carboxypeptidase (penicillin-binding protein 5/6)
MPATRRFRAGSITVAGFVVASAIGLAPAAASQQAPGSPHQAGHGPEGVAAAGADLANGITGKQRWGREQYTRRPIASITKIMTALVVIHAGHLSRRIRITQADVDYVVVNGASNAGLRAGDVLTARQLLYAMLLPSGADAALALADSYGPGWPAFVRKMNATARRLHLQRTHFTNFDGLQDSDVSTPRNLLMLGEAVMRQQVFRDVVKRKWYYLRATADHRSYFWRNSNLLLRDYPSVIGIKTGWTPGAGECLLFEATHGKRELIGVVLDSAPTNSGATFAAAARMLNWGFGLHEPLPPPRQPGDIPPG